MGTHTHKGLRSPEETQKNIWTVSLGGLLGKESGDYDPKDPDKFKRLADHYRAISDAEQAAEEAAAEAAAAGKPDTKPAA